MMIRIAHEGEIINPGINVGWSFHGLVKYVRFIYCSISLFKDHSNEGYTPYREHVPVVSHYYLRVKTKWPFLVYKKIKYDLIDNYLVNNSMVILTRETYSDLINYLPKHSKEELIRDFYKPYKGYYETDKTA